jgi:membrane protease YdiL (CAAX protease family)
MPELTLREGSHPRSPRAPHGIDPDPNAGLAGALGRGALREALWVSADVTLAVAVIAAVAPVSSHTTAVGFVFLAATWLLVWRRDDDRVRAAGLALGGLVIPGKLDARGALRAAMRAASWAGALAVLVAVPFYAGWRAWWAPTLGFSLSARPLEMTDEVLGQVFVIALPEEAFYRGYLQSRLDEVWSPRWTVLGARVGPGLLVAAVIFAVSHLATVQMATRLAVFFPAVLFGWLRAKTGGIGASILFHAFCNVYSQVLGRGFGIY